MKAYDTEIGGGPQTIDFEGNSKGCSKRKCKSCLRGNLLIILLISSMAIGICMGIGIRYRQPPLTSREIMYFRFPGDLLMRMLKLLILPLIVSSLIAGLANLDTRSSGWMGIRAIVYYLSTTMLAVILGIILVLAIRPGGNQRAADINRSSRVMPIVNPADALLDLLRNCFPSNIVVATFRQTKTTLTEKATVASTVSPNDTMLPTTKAPDSNTTVPPPPKLYDFNVGESSGTNVLGIVVFCIAVGIAIGRLGEKANVLKSFFTQLGDVVMMLVTLVIWYSPIGIAFLIAAKIIEMKDPALVVAQLGMYSMTVIVGLIIHGYILLPLIYLAVVRRNPYRYIYGCLQAILTALATASSSATLPVTLRCVEENNHVNPKVTRFVMPVGATINMDGTALYEAVAAIFIAQVNGIALNVGQVITVSLTATAAAIGAAGVPQAGLVTMVIVLTAVGLPTDDVTLIIAVDWLLDRFRTSVNVLGDTIGAAIVEKLSYNELAAKEEDS